MKADERYWISSAFSQPTQHGEWKGLAFSTRMAMEAAAPFSGIARHLVQ